MPSPVYPLDLTYDGLGRLETIDHGGRIWTIAYNPSGYVASVEDPRGDVVSYVDYDGAGRPKEVHLMGHSAAAPRVLSLAYDEAGNVKSLTTPGTAQTDRDHLMTYTPVDLPETYEPPLAPSPDHITSRSTYNRAGECQGS